MALLALLLCTLLASPTIGFQSSGVVVSFTTSTSASTSPLFMSTTESESPTTTTANTKKGGYVPKWTKKKTLADSSDGLDFADKGIKGTIPVVFQQGDERRMTMAMPGQPLRDVATQAGQFIKYGCGKGECGTCEALCGGKWVRPCKDVVPALDAGQDQLVVQVKQVAHKSNSSGQFFSIKSFFMGFYNNALGMIGFVKYRQNAKKNWEERQEYEALIRRLTLEKRAARLARQGQPLTSSSISAENGSLSP